MDRYFQIARCFRDEDQRGDRQPEFTQLDLEMSFVEREDVMDLLEGLYAELVAEVTPDKKIYQTPWPKITYQESLNRFGKDNPDIRFGLELKDISDLAQDSGFKVFSETVKKSGVRPVVCINSFYTDTKAEIELVRRVSEASGALAAVSEHWLKGGEGSIEFAEEGRI